MKPPHRLIEGAVRRRVHETAEQLRRTGRLDRRAFVRATALGLITPLVAACAARGGDAALRILSAAERRNERLERWMLRIADGTDRVSTGRAVAGDAFPSYFVSDTVPVWDRVTRGAWTLEIDGAVRRPQKLSFDELLALGTRTQRVNHYCVEGWNAVAEFRGVPFTTIARITEPTADAGYVDFASFDDDYHESWDVQSAMHPQTMIVLAKDGQPLSPEYGAPARVHSPVKLGYKNTKYLTRITFLPQPNGGYWSDEGYEWFAGT